MIVFIQAYYRDADALLLVFDVTNPLSFSNIRAWMDDVAEFASPDVKVEFLQAVYFSD